MKIQVAFGAFSDPISKQLKAQGYAAKQGDVKTWDGIAFGVTLGLIHGLITPTEAHKIRNRIVAAVGGRAVPIAEADFPMEEPVPRSVEEIVLKYLESSGFDGLYSPDGDCACVADDFAPCGEMSGECRAGYRIDCSERDFRISENREVDRDG